ncbi:hypothetical protein K488DRAFT_88540 [Vararia minispora EC-137]|uniref:Uncharacterized protein n=1 Tax=Vararia minispora EC-137 TaxID=1314806 RepID=A0ACB8QD70_9AGAM|nr:hypothetical protein K488DRAFT_88540 [Vararia minispora EC-137]
MAGAYANATPDKATRIQSHFEQWSDHELSLVVEKRDTIRASLKPDPDVDSETWVMRDATRKMDAPANVLGRKPGSMGWSPAEIRIVNIPESEYALRLWAQEGVAKRGMWVLDFVRTADEKPVNLPPGFKLWMAPWTSNLLRYARLDSSEILMGLAREEIRDGAEKWFVNEGMKCKLQRGSLDKGIVFHIPSRKSPDEGEYLDLSE